MKHASLPLAIVIGFALGWVANGATVGRPAARPAPSAQAQAQARVARPTEDPKAVYRVPLEDSTMVTRASAGPFTGESSSGTR